MTDQYDAYEYIAALESVARAASVYLQAGLGIDEGKYWLVRNALASTLEDLENFKESDISYDPDEYLG